MGEADWVVGGVGYGWVVKGWPWANCGTLANAAGRVSGSRISGPFPGWVVGEAG